LVKESFNNFAGIKNADEVVCLKQLYRCSVWRSGGKVICTELAVSLFRVILRKRNSVKWIGNLIGKCI